MIENELIDKCIGLLKDKGNTFRFEDVFLIQTKQDMKDFYIALRLLESAGLVKPILTDRMKRYEKIQPLFSQVVDAGSWTLYKQGLEEKKTADTSRQEKMDKKLDADLPKSVADNKYKYFFYCFLALGAAWTLYQLMRAICF